MEAEPFGFGLGNSGPVSGLGGRSTDLLEGHGLTSETQYNVLVKELGLPGLLLWPLLAGYVIFLIVTGIRRVRDPDLLICLAGALAMFLVLPIDGTAALPVDRRGDRPVLLVCDRYRRVLVRRSRARAQRLALRTGYDARLTAAA